MAADTIFMIHGMWGGPWYWSGYQQIFEAAGYRCVTTTLPYHDMDPQGIPDARLGTTSLLDYARALEEEIGQLADPPIIMGHSMGGLLGQMLGSRGLAKSLVLLDAGISGRNPGAYAIRGPKLLEHADDLGLLEKTDASDICRGRLLHAESVSGRRTKGSIRKVRLRIRTSGL